MAVLSKVKVGPQINNPLPKSTVTATFRVSQIVPGATRVQVTYKLLGGLVNFALPSAPADGATVLRQIPRELVEEYADFTKLASVVRTLDLQADPSARGDTLEVTVVDVIDGKPFETRTSVAVIGFA